MIVSWAIENNLVNICAFENISFYFKDILVGL